MLNWQTYLQNLNIDPRIGWQEIEMVEQDFVNEKKSAVREFEDQKIDLRDQVPIQPNTLLPILHIFVRFLHKIVYFFTNSTNLGSKL
jgi:hypothetical protein